LQIQLWTCKNTNIGFVVATTAAAGMIFLHSSFSKHIQKHAKANGSSEIDYFTWKEIKLVG